MQSTTGKSLSNGTMSLRFMQNALRSKQQSAVDLERAKVKDDAEWEISKDVRDAWGLSSSSRQRDPSVSYESSYLPFLFSSPNDADQSSSEDESSQAPSTTTTLKPSGRRTFDDGREVIASPPAVVEEGTAVAEIAISPKKELQEGARAGGKGSRVGRPGLLSTVKGRLHQTNPARSDKPSTTKFEKMATGAPVLQMISEQTVQTVGVDLRASRQTQPAPSKSASNSSKGSLNFLRPAGVDGPVVNGPKAVKRARGNSVSESSTSSTLKASVDGLGAGEPTEERKKRKKKQKRTAPSDNQD